MTVKLTWLGEDDLHKTVTDDGHTIEGAGPSFTTWGGVKFPKDVAVVVSDPDIIRRAKGNRFFTVYDDGDELPKRGPGRPPKVRDDGEDTA